MPLPRQQTAAATASGQHTLTPEDVAEVVEALAAGGGGGPIRDGPPHARGSVQYYLDLDSVDAGDRADAVFFFFSMVSVTKG